jgi:hypothetical protein
MVRFSLLVYLWLISRAERDQPLDFSDAGLILPANPMSVSKFLSHL